MNSGRNQKSVRMTALLRGNLGGTRSMKRSIWSRRGEEFAGKNREGGGCPPHSSWAREKWGKRSNNVKVGPLSPRYRWEFSEKKQRIQAAKKDSLLKFLLWGVARNSAKRGMRESCGHGIFSSNQKLRAHVYSSSLVATNGCKNTE